MPSAELTLSLKGFKEGVKDVEALGKASDDTGKKIDKAGKSSGVFNNINKDLKNVKDVVGAASSGMGNFIGNLTGGWAGAVRIAADVAGFALNISEKLSSGASHYKEIDFGNATEQQRALEDSSSRLAMRTGESSREIEKNAKSVAERIGESQQAVIDSASAYIQLSQSTKDSSGAMSVISEVADKSGRKLSDVVPRAAAIGRAFGSTGEQLKSSFSAIERISEQAGNQGGLLAFEQTIAELGPMLENLGVKTDESRNKILSFISAAGKDFKPKEAAQISSNLIDKLKQNSFQISRVLGHDILDKKTGKLTDPIQTLKELQGYAFKYRGGEGSNRALWALRQYLGNEGGSFLANADFTEIEKNAKLATEKPKTETQKSLFSETKSGARNIFDVKHENELLKTGTVNLMTRDVGQKNVSNFTDLVDKEFKMGNMPSMLSRLDKWVESSHNKEQALSALDRENPDLANEVRRNEEKNSIQLRPVPMSDVDWGDDAYEYTEKLHEERAAARKAALERQDKYFKEHPKEVQQLANSMSKLQAVVKNGIIEGLKGANLYVKTPILPPTNPSPGNQNPPSQ